jgi:hypothetical protein
MLNIEIARIGVPDPPQMPTGDNPIRETVVAFMNKYIADVRNSLVKKRKVASRGLWQSVSFVPIQLGNRGIKVQFMMDNYWKQVNEGLQGEKDGSLAPNSSMRVGRNVPRVTSKKIELWAAYRSIPANVREKIAPAIAKKVNARGYRPSYFYDEVQNDPKRWQQFIDDLKEVAGALIFNEAIELTKDQQKAEKGI